MEKYLTVKDVKNILNLGTNKTYNLVNKKSFPKIRVGNAIRIPESKFYEYLERYAYKRIDI